MLEEGKIYIVKVNSGNLWLFKKFRGVLFADRYTGCNGALCLNDMYKTNDVGYVCGNSEIAYCKVANENYIAIWNREFNDNIELR